MATMTMQRVSCDGDEGERQRRESEEEAESDWESKGPEGFVSGYSIKMPQMTPY